MARAPALAVVGLGVATAGAALAQHAGMAMPGPAPGMSAAERGFLAESDAGMRRMMADMAVKPTGSVDRDFVAMMVPHHEGAIAMAQAMLKYGTNERLKAMARDIVAAQEKEVVEMKAALAK